MKKYLARSRSDDMSARNRGMAQMDLSGMEEYAKYHETIYGEKHERRNYELTSAGYQEWYYDCLPKDKKARILDLGCGDGKFLFFLQGNGYTDIEGLELSSQQADEARRHVKCPINVVADTYTFLQEHPATYMMITMNDVLEHIPKDKTVNLLKALLLALKPGGTLVINVPQVSGFTSLYHRYDDFTHKTLFTEMSLKQILLSAGFSEVRFIRQKWPLKWTPRHIAYRLARRLWYGILKLIYIIESPTGTHPGSFQVRLVASAMRPHIHNDERL
jgi:2-polyprenyl-3-methyl-5-hydroxy-6-metoxy-1,4-benzoquinol methylase